MLPLRVLCVIVGFVCIQAPLPDANGQTARKPSPASQRERPDPPEARERDYVPETYTGRNPPRTRRPSSSSPSAKPKEAQPKSAWTPAPPRDKDLARCDDFRRRFEQVLREEGRGGSAAQMQRLTHERQSIYREQLRAGCV